MVLLHLFIILVQKRQPYRSEIARNGKPSIHICYLNNLKYSLHCGEELQNTSVLLVSQNDTDSAGQINCVHSERMENWDSRPHDKLCAWRFKQVCLGSQIKRAWCLCANLRIVWIPQNCRGIHSLSIARMNKNSQSPFVFMQNVITEAIPWMWQSIWTINAARSS